MLFKKRLNLFFEHSAQADCSIFMQSSEKNIILYDDMCGLCNHAAGFVLKNDKKHKFSFISFRSDDGKKLIESKSIKITGTMPDTICFIEKGQVYTKSTAIIKICTHLGGLWKLLLILFIIPKILRDKVYDLISRNRYRLSGIKGSCLNN